jgi:hypothetical protein
MKRIVSLCLLLLTAWTTHAAENAAQHAYNFTVTSKTGDVLGNGKIRLPFKLGSNGKGTADWEFALSRAYNTNKYWLKAKGRLAKGNGKANARCSNSFLTLDFNPGWNDNNVTVSWQLKEQESGTLSYSDFAGGHECALFKILQIPDPAVPPSGTLPKEYRESTTNRGRAP